MLRLPRVKNTAPRSGSALAGAIERRGEREDMTLSPFGAPVPAQRPDDQEQRTDDVGAGHERK